jgi:hypothetical protein
LGWVDLDMVKGHPTILCEVALKNNIKLKTFQNYLTNNVNIFKDLIKFYFGDNQIEYDKKKDYVKDIFNILIYGGSFKTRIDDMNEKSIELLTTDIHYFITEFRKDCKMLIDIIYDNNEDILNIVRGNIVDEYKLKNRVMSYFCGTIENEILFVCYKYLVENKIIDPRKNNALEYDGLCFKPKIELDKHKIIENINKQIISKTGLKVCMDWKPYSVYVNQNIIEERKKLIAEHNFDVSYYCIKKDFEHKHCKIINRNIFIKKNKETFVMMSKSHLLTAHEHLHFKKPIIADGIVTGF